MDANPLAAFAAALTEYQLLPAAQLEEIARSPLVQGSDVRPLSRDLVERGLLTSYQVNQLIQGRGKDLVVGPYLLLDRIGEGGMGQVFKARHRSTGQPAAIKLVRNQILANPNALKRFWQEVTLTAQLRHPNIVQAYAAGQVDRGHYFSMEYIEGIDLLRLVKESGPLPLGQASDYMRQAALGLQHAHEKGLVHRDIKPANLMVTGSQLKILDLGLARLRDQDQESGLTRVGAILGTPEFLSPEQTQNSRAVDIRADLYSLGCTFFFLLAGKEPFSAASVPEILLKHHFDQPPALAPLRPDVPAAVQAIIHKLMAKRPDDRYQTPAELAEALKPYCQATAQPTARTSAAPVKAAKPGKVASVFGLMLRRKNKRKAAPSVTPGRRRGQGRTRRALVAITICAALGAVGLFLLENTFGITGLTKHTADKSSEFAGLSTGLESRPEATRSESRPETRTESRPETKPETKPARPETKPEVKPPTKPEVKPPIKPELKPEPKPAVKKPVPEADKQAEAQKQVHAAHTDDYARKKPADQLTLSGRLVREANAAQDDPAVRFVLFREARDLAAQAGDLDESFRVIADMATWFTVEVREQRAEALAVAARSADLSPSDMKAVADKAILQADLAVDANDYEAAVRMLAAAEAAARKAKNTALANQVQAQGKELAEAGKEYALVKADAETLRTQPDSAAANYRWGRFVCLFRDNWSEGLPLVAKGNNAAWKALAVKEQADPKAASERVDLAKGWLAQAAHEKGTARKHLLRHAKKLFEQAAPKLTELARFQAEKHIREIDQETGDAPTLPKTSSDKFVVTGKKYEQCMQAATTAMDKGRFSDAVQAYGEALYWKPNDPDATAGKRQALYASCMAKGNALLEKKRFAEAAAEFNRALKEMPGDPLAQAALEKAQGMK